MNDNPVNYLMNGDSYQMLLTEIYCFDARMTVGFSIIPMKHENEFWNLDINSALSCGKVN